MKKRIMVTVVTEDGKYEFSNVEGREMANGLPSPGPTKKQFEIISRTISKLCSAPSFDAKIDGKRIVSHTRVRRSAK